MRTKFYERYNSADKNEAAKNAPPKPVKGTSKLDDLFAEDISDLLEDERKKPDTDFLSNLLDGTKPKTGSAEVVGKTSRPNSSENIRVSCFGDFRLLPSNLCLPKLQKVAIPI